MLQSNFSVGRLFANARFTIPLLLAGLIFQGCGPGVPPIVSVGGTVTLNDKPLPDAQVRFTPLHPGLNGNYVASGVTDGDGAYTLQMPAVKESGVCACEYKVTVSEGPIPDQLRKMGQAGGPKIAKYRKSLKNRPIPGRYSIISKTPLKLTVTSDKTEYLLELER